MKSPGCGGKMQYVVNRVKARYKPVGNVTLFLSKIIKAGVCMCACVPVYVHVRKFVQAKQRGC